MAATDFTGWPHDARRAPASEADKRYPWEVYGVHGESLLPNLYYAESSDNQQIMPLTIRHRLFIDRMVYPTLGHPSLVDKSDASDRLTVVLRIEPEALAHLDANYSDDADPFEAAMTLANSQNPGDANQLAFFLASRAVRAADGTVAGANQLESTAPMMAAGGQNDIMQIVPTKIQVDRESNAMPSEFKQRKTLRVSFDASQLQGIPAGLYDLRFQVVKNGKIVQLASHALAYEYQYNAVRVFDSVNANQYSVLNITDSQVSGGKDYKKITIDKLNDFVNYVVTTNDERVRRAAFITFNGDLHNGGAPGGLASRFVAITYNAEAHMITDALKKLTIPIFLVPGNHDGYSGMTASPDTIDRLENEVGSYSGKLGDAINGMFSGQSDDLVDQYLKSDFLEHAHIPLAAVVQKYAIDSHESNWPGLTLQSYLSDSAAAKANPGGKHNNIVTGKFMRLVPTGDDIDSLWASSWRQIVESERNMILFDGFQQWQKTYGPLYYSWTFGQNHYTSMNSFEMRQHRRSGWGMYTVNYGGWVSPVQLDWLERDLDRNQLANRDLILLAHHDPRGGNDGRDYPYYFRQVDFTGIGLSAYNYIKGEIVEKKVCGTAPELTQVRHKVQGELGCLHDGLQEWMRPDPEFDCTPDMRLAHDAQFRCDLALMKSSGRRPWSSGYDMISLFAGRPADAQKRATIYPNLRTILLGHTHYNSMEVYQNGQELIPGAVKLDYETVKLREDYESANPLRAATALAKSAASTDHDYMTSTNMGYDLDLAKYYPDLHRQLIGNRELAILRMTSVSNITSQINRDGKTMYGFGVFDVMTRADSRGYALPQINSVTYYRNTNPSSFVADSVGIAIPRTESTSYRQDNFKGDDAKKNPILRAGMSLK